MIRDIIGLILLGITISVGIATGFNPKKMAIKMRSMAMGALHDTRKTQLPTVKGVQSPNPYGCGSYECYQKMKYHIQINFLQILKGCQIYSRQPL